MIAKPPAANTLYYGDNLAVMRAHIPDGSVDLVYLDPPFNSNASYNVLFKAPEGHQSQAQIEAFDDTWHWNDSAELACDEINKSKKHSDVSTMLRAMRNFLGDNDMMAYLAMMAVRLIELHRVLKPTGSIYLHCDPTASHYLKILLDAVFGKGAFLNEIIWKRTYAHGSSQRFGPVHDVIFYYAKNGGHVWTNVRINHDPDYIEKHFRQTDAVRNEQFQAISLTGAGIRKGDSGKPWRNVDPSLVNRHWALPGAIVEKEGIEGGTVQQRLDALDKAGRIFWPETGSTPRLKWFVSDLGGAAIADTWTDIAPIGAQAKERLGYPTQKPVALLERILAASSNEGDVVLDPFCGCGTTLHAAAKMNRNWIGIDVTHLAIGLIRRRLTDAFPQIAFNVAGVPKDIGGARALASQDKYEFQKWALSMIHSQPYKGGKKGGDGGVDGFLYFKLESKKTEVAIVSVKGGGNLNPGMIKDLIVTVDQQGAKMGVFLTLEPPTKGMVAQAAAAGLFKTDFGNFPKIQIVTVAQLFLPGNPLQIPWQDTSVFKKTKREDTKAQSKLDL